MVRRATLQAQSTLPDAKAYSKNPKLAAQEIHSATAGTARRFARDEKLPFDSGFRK